MKILGNVMVPVFVMLQQLEVLMTEVGMQKGRITASHS